MVSLEKKAKRLDPIIDQRKISFDDENQRLLLVRKQKIEAIAAMKFQQRQYMEGVQRLNSERGSANRNLLEALEGGLDSIKQTWMELYQSVLDWEKKENEQFLIMSEAHKSLETIKHLKNKYEQEVNRERARKEQKSMDDLALRRFSHS